MSVITFELKEEHLKLLKFIKWSMTDNKLIISTDENIEGATSFGEDNLYEAIDLILNGRPTNFDPLNTHEPPSYTSEQIAEWDKLYNELPTALDLILFNGHFELGRYKTRFHERNWRLIQLGEISK